MPTEHIIALLIALLIADRDKTQPGDKEAQERKVGRRAQSTIPAHEGVLSGEAEEAARISAKLFNPLVNFAGPQVARFTVSAHTCTILTSQRQYVNDDR